MAGMAFALAGAPNHAPAATLRGVMELKGQWVEFAIKDIYFPVPEIVLAALHGDDVMSGEIIDVSDGGSSEAAYAVVKVAMLHEPLVVPIRSIRER
jgi:hypothetical protein